MKKKQPDGPLLVRVSAYVLFALSLLALPLSAPAQERNAPVRLALDATPRQEQSAAQTSSLSAVQSSFYKQLDSYATYMPALQIAAQIDTKIAEEPTALTFALSWARDRSQNPAGLNSLYLMIYSDLSARTARLTRAPAAKRDYNRAAFQALVSFEALLMTDIARCGDPVTRGAAPQLLGPRYERLAVFSASLSAAEMTSIWTAALAAEAAAAGRARNAEICSNGIVAAMATDAVAGMAADAAAGETDPDKGATLTFNPALQKVDPVYIDDAAWTVARGKAREQLLATWKQRYAASVTH